MRSFRRDWKESWIDEMGLIVALSGTERFDKMARIKTAMKSLPNDQRHELSEAIRMRFTPSNGHDGCQGGMTAIAEATKELQPN